MLFIPNVKNNLLLWVFGTHYDIEYKRRNELRNYEPVFR